MTLLCPNEKHGFKDKDLRFFITLNQLLGYSIAFQELTSDFWKNDNVEMTLCLNVNIS